MTTTIWLILVAAIAVGIGAYIDVRLFRRVSLRAKLILTFVPVLLLAVAVLGIFTDQGVRRALTTAANQALITASGESANRLDAFFLGSLDAMRTEAELPDFVALLDRNYFRPNFGNQVDILNSLRQKDPDYILSYGLLDKAGLDVSDTNSAYFGKDESSREYFRVPLVSRQPYISPVYFENEHSPVFYLSAPVFGAENDIVGVLRVKYSAEILQDLMERSANNAGPGSFAVLFDENHMHLAHGDADIAPSVNYKLLVPPTNLEWLTQMQQKLRLPPGSPEELAVNLPDLEANLRNSLSEPTFSATDIATGNKIDQVAVTHLQSQPWLVAFFQPREIFLAPITGQRRQVLAVTLAVGLGALIASVWLGQVISAPIIRLTTVAQEVAEGQLDVLAPVEGHDEISQLARVFNDMTSRLRHLIGSLEEQVADRTAELTLSMEVGQRAAAIREESKLLPTITEFIRQQFNLYYVQVYYVDDLGQSIVLRQGTGEFGEKLRERRHHLPVGAGSIVGQVAATGRSIVVADTELSDIHKPNPLLPATRSELAVPLMVEGRVIGVLDMQADEPYTFTKKNLTVFEAMATQLAIAIDGAHQWAAAQDAQQRAERALRRQTREAWQETLEERYRSRDGIGFSYNLSGIEPVEKLTTPTNGSATVSAPLVVQEEEIGVLLMKLPESQNSADAAIILRAVAQQLSQKIETLRLFETTQRSAWRDQIVSEATSSIWSTAEVEDVMKAAVAELGEKLHASEVVIRLGSDVKWLAELGPSAQTDADDTENGSK